MNENLNLSRGQCAAILFQEPRHLRSLAATRQDTFQLLLRDGRPEEGIIEGWSRSHLAVVTMTAGAVLLEEATERLNLRGEQWPVFLLRLARQIAPGCKQGKRKRDRETKRQHDRIAPVSVPVGLDHLRHDVSPSIT